MKPSNNNFRFRNNFLKIFLLILFLLQFYPDANSTTFNITAQDFSFTPSNITVTVGDTIKWTWLGPHNYTTTCDGVFPGTSLSSGAAPWDSPLNSGNPIFSYIVTVDGTYDYVCQFHAPDMAGTIVAEQLLPVELTDFVATTIKNEVILDWATSSEFNNDRFEVQRVDLGSLKDYNPKDLLFTTIGLLSGYGTSPQPHTYRFIDRNLTTGKYLYRLKQIDFNSNYIFHLLPDEVVIGIPNKFSLSQNYPNPFNPTTKINYELPNDGFVSLILFDINGKEISRLINEYKTAGYQTVELNASSLSSGVYYYRIDYNNNGKGITKTKKLMLVK